MAMLSTIDQTDTQPLIVQLFLERERLDDKKLEILREAQAKDNSPVEQILIKKELVNDRDIATAYAEHLGFPMLEKPEELAETGAELNHHVRLKLCNLLPEKLCRDQLIAPVAISEDRLQVAFVTPNEMLIIDEIQLLTGLTVTPLLAPLSVVEGLIETLYGGGQATQEFVSSEKFEQEEEQEEETTREREDEILHLDQPPPPGRDGRIIRLVNQILEQALRSGASDIHLEPFEDGCKFRLRIDGMLHELPSPSRAQFLPVVSRFKILAKMDIAEKRVPQDGAIALRAAATNALTSASIPCPPCTARRWSCEFWTKAPSRFS